MLWLIGLFVAALLSGLCPPSVSHAQQNDEDWAIGVNPVPPFMMQDQDGSWYGLGIDLMKSMTDNLGIGYHMVETAPEAMVGAVRDGTLDAAIGAVPINAADEAIIDFSLPYYSGDIGVALRLVDRLGPQFIFRILASPAFLYMLGLLTGPVFVIGALVWFVERRANPEQFEPRPARGLFSGFWWAAVTMTTVGYGDKSPVTFIGRLLAMGWMISALILASITTAQLAAGLTSSLNTNFIDSIGDLSGLDVGTIGQSSAATELKVLNIPATHYDTIADGLTALERREIDAFVYDRAALQWALRRYRDLYLTNLQFSQQSYGLIMPQDSPDRDRINIAILDTLQTQQWHLIVERYLPSDGD
ncbi:hypothetical protein TM49_10535 [Martelella endophytica]|uniref:Ionotropic glutamate receptor C-terminal domain-containing protein n=1 Tax=Martelella endophytica TaxID=1486262 RepID=A0A0D5LPZ8_MAREN|nr:hypothetical protein TM49_10535 [Martelella endophytica]